VKSDEVQALRDAHTRVLERIADACARVRRDPGTVTLVAVSKTVPAERLRHAVDAGLGVFGENRVQEALAKIPEVPGAGWHLIGPLQSNKARRALEAFEIIESVDSVGLAARLDRLAGELGMARIPVLLQVNVDLDAAKAGFRPDDLAGAIGELARLDRLDVRGCMTIGREAARPDEARRTFVSLRELAATLRDVWSGLGPELSMGMSDDYPIAVEEGATIVRVGRALFGERPHEH
jgi:pyridoxal phosphate enzyme (YggS family)